MPSITRYNITSYLDRFTPLIKQLLSAPPLQPVHVRVFNATTSTFSITIREVINKLVIYYRELSTTVPFAELMAFQLRTSYRIIGHDTIRIGHKNTVDYTPPVIVDFNFLTGECTEFYDDADLSRPSLSPTSGVANPVEHIRFDLPYDPDLFSAFCVLRSRGIISHPVTLRNIVMDDLPPWQHHPNIIVIEPEANTIAIL
jgi:hypothetical protein